jgi:hypothetical protein
VEERSRDFYGGHGRRISPERFQPQVDYQSELRIMVNTNELPQASTNGPSVLSTLSAQQKAKLDQLQNLLQAGQKYVKDFNQFVNEYDKLSASGPAVDVGKFRQLIKDQGRSGLRVFVPLKSYLDAKIREARPDVTQRELIQEEDLLTRNIYPPGRAIDLSALSDFVAAETSLVTQQAVRDAQMVRDSASVHLRMRASAILSPGQAATPVHIRNYDTLSDSDVVQEPRISFKMSDDDRQRLTAETKVNSELAQFIRDVRDGKSDIRQSFDSIVSGLRLDLKSWKDAASNVDSLKKRLEPIIAALDKSATGAQLSQAQKGVLGDARNLLAVATNNLHDIESAIQGVVATNSPDSDATTVLVNAADRLSTALADVADLPTIISTNVSSALDHIQMLIGDVRTNNAAALSSVQDLADLLKAGFPTSAETIKALLNTVFEHYPDLMAQLKSLSIKGDLMGADAKLPPIQSDSHLLDITVKNPPDGFISLQRNIPREGAILSLDAALITGQDSTPEVNNIAHQEFVIERFGLINTWAANLIFVKRLGNLGTNEQKVDFSPAPSISWTLHYNPLPSEKPRNKFWDVSYPGVGLNVAALNWDNGVQVGIGGHVSIFHDLLVAGAGYNLQKTSHGGYAFIGVGIFQALSQMGVTGANFPLGH